VIFNRLKSWPACDSLGSWSVVYACQGGLETRPYGHRAKPAPLSDVCSTKRKGRV